MTYFNNLNHQLLKHHYNRVIFEFTDEEQQSAGFLKTSKEPAILEILRLLNRIYENDIEEKSIQDHVNSFINSNQLLPESNSGTDLSRTKAVRKELHDCIDAGNYKLAADIIKQVHSDNESILKDLENKKTTHTLYIVPDNEKKETLNKRISPRVEPVKPYKRSKPGKTNKTVPVKRNKRSTPNGE